MGLSGVTPASFTATVRASGLSRTSSFVVAEVVRRYPGASTRSCEMRGRFGKTNAPVASAVITLVPCVTVAATPSPV